MKDIKGKIKGKHCTRHIIRLSEVHMKKWRMSDVGQIVTRRAVHLGDLWKDQRPNRPPMDPPRRTCCSWQLTTEREKKERV